jgi:AraC-like DNA-binding protein
MVSGLHAAPAVIRYDRRQHGIQLGLTPAGSRALLGVPASALVRTLLPLRELLGPGTDRMYDEVAGAATWAERYDALDRHLLARAGSLAGTTPVRAELRHAWAALEQRDDVHVAEVAAELGWSRRHLTTAFTGEFGLRPKQLARVARFQRARALLPQTGLARVSAEAGYADQAHLTREWRELSGYTPTEWMRAEFPFLQDPVSAT